MTDTIVLGDTTQVARKSYGCDQCPSKIEPGQRYRRQWGVWDGCACTYRAHVECDAAACALHALHDLQGDEGVYLPSDIHEDDYPWLLAEHPVVAARLEIFSEKKEADHAAS